MNTTVIFRADGCLRTLPAKQNIFTSLVMFTSRSTNSTYLLTYSMEQSPSSEANQ